MDVLGPYQVVHGGDVVDQKNFAQEMRRGPVDDGVH
jgi:hypothetical protein